MDDQPLSPHGNLESVFSLVLEDLCTTKASNAQLKLWGPICEAESDSIRDGFEMDVMDLHHNCVDRQTFINDEYAAQGGKLDNLPPSIFKDTDTLLSVLPPTDSLPDDTASHDALLSDLCQLYQSKEHLDLSSVQEQPPPVHSTALNPDAVQSAAEQKEREQLLAGNNHVAAQRREEQRYKEQQRIQAKQNQKEKAGHASAFCTDLPEEEPHQKIKDEGEIPISEVMDTSGSDSEAELLAHIPSGMIPFCRMNKSIQDKLIIRYNNLLPKDFNKHHYPSYIRLVATFKNISTRLR